MDVDADVYIAQKYYGPMIASDGPAATASILAVTQRPPNSLSP